MSIKPTTAIKTAFSACLILAVYPQLSAAKDRDAIPRTPAENALSYADLADLTDASTLVAVARIRNIIKIPSRGTSAVSAGHQRLYLEADVSRLIRGEAGISPRVRYLYDVPLDSRGKLPKLKKTEVILFARSGSRPGEIQLVAPDAQLPATPNVVDRVAAILSELMANGAPPRFVGLGDAFHVTGTVAGESETQLFLRTENGDPVSLSILRRPGQDPRWAVALGEIVDEAARPPAPGSLLWYRLACSLPPALPAQSVHSLSPQDADAARTDYALVISSLGPCDRSRLRL